MSRSMLVSAVAVCMLAATGTAQRTRWSPQSAGYSASAYTVQGPSPPYTWMFERPLQLAPVATPKYTANINGTAINYYEVNIEKFQSDIYPNLGPCNLVGYNASSPGPLFRVPVGVEQVVRFTNHGDLSSAVHLHGSPTRSPWDGWASDDIDPGQFKDYYYPASPNSKTLLYHDHALNHTAVDAYYGQSGMHIFYDPAEDVLELPSGEYDVALTFADKIYTSTGDLVSPADERVNWWGDILHVNGRPWPYFEVEPRQYRLRLLVSGLSRPYEVMFEQDTTGDGADFAVIASDAGLFPNPVMNTSSLVLSMGERYEIVIDFSEFAGTNVTMYNIYNNANSQIPNYINTNKLMRFVVGTAATSTEGNKPVPSSLPGVALDLPAMKTTVDHVFGFQRNPANWTINGVVFDDANNRVLARPPAGTVERWTLSYQGGPGVHPVHLHLVEFQILSRNGPRGLLPYETAGMKDVVLLEPGETVDVLAKYGPWNGLYQFHCHNLVHEDNEMMAAFNVTALMDLGYDDVMAFDDPMDTRFLAKNIDAKYYTEDYILNTLLPGFVNSAAYSKESDLEDAQEQYYKVNPYGEVAATTVKPTMTGAGARHGKSKPMQTGAAFRMLAPHGRRRSDVLDMA